MEQVSQFVAGERDYTKIEGGTGPLVYPAAHVYTYTGLWYLTREGKDIFLAQQLFAGLYLLTLAVVMGCYWQAKVRLDLGLSLNLGLDLSLDMALGSRHVFKRGLTTLPRIGSAIHLPPPHPL